MKLKATLSKKVKFWLDNQPNHLIFLHPKLYFGIKSGLLLAIIIQRILFLVDNDSENKSYFDLLQLGGFILLFLMEGAMFKFIEKNKRAKRVSEILFCGFQILFSEFIIALSTALSTSLSENFEDQLVYIIQQEILFIFILITLFTDSFIIKSSLFFYITPTFLFRLSPSLSPIHYIGWLMMTLTMLTTCLIFFISPEKIIKVSKDKKDFANLENIPQGLAILTRDKEVIFMNGVFKGILDLANEKDALNKIMKLKRFEAFSEQDQQHFLQEIKVRNSFNVAAQSKEKELQKQATGGKNRFITLLSRRLTKKASMAGNVPAILVNKPTYLEHTDSLRKNMENQYHQSTSFGTTTLGSPDSFHLFCKKDLSSPVDPRRASAYAKDFKHLSSIQTDADSQYTVEFSINNIFPTMSEVGPRRKLSLASVAKNVVNGLAFTRMSSQHFRASNTLSLTNNKTQKIQAVNRNAKGELRILELTLTPMISDNKDALFVYLTDVTSEMKAKELQETSQYKDQLLKFVSHEFRTPLNCSIMSLNMLQPLVSKELNENYLTPALNSTMMLLNLVNDILDYSQMQAKKLKIAIFPCNLKHILKDVITMMEMQALAHNIELKLDWDNKIPRIYHTDGNRLKQILLNLISNALKFTQQGSITIRAKYMDTSTCRIDVIDTGVGISQEGLENLFKEFGKIQENIHLNPQGVGLGLVISKLLSQELGPDKEGIQVHSEVGVGTTFYFLLSSKKDDPDHAGFENTDLVSSDEDETMGPQSLMSKLQRGNTRHLSVTKKALVREDSKSSVKSQGKEKTKAKTMGPKGGDYDIDPFTFNFMHLYSKSTFTKMQTLITRVAPFAQPRGSYFYKNRRLDKKMDPKIKRCLSSGTMLNVEDDYTDHVSQIFKTLNQNCKCAKVLLVDDDAFNITALKLLLKTIGIEAHGVVDGEQAIQEVLDNEGHSYNCRNYAMIFMDVEMPRLSGFDAAKALRRMMLDREITYIPIIGVSGHNPAEKRVECLLSGMNDMIPKPVNKQVIQEAISKWVTI